MGNIIEIEVHHENPDIIGRMEEAMSLSIGYKVTVADILCYPKNKTERIMQRECEKIFFIIAMKRIKAKRILSHNKKYLCHQK